MLKDSLKVERGLEGYVITRELIEQIDAEEFKRRLTELGSNKKHLENEKEKAEQAIKNIDREIELIERNISLLTEAKEKGVALHTEER